MSDDWAVKHLRDHVEATQHVLNRLSRAEERVRLLERVLKQAVITHGGVLRVSHIAATKLTGREVIEIGSDSSDPGYGHVTLSVENGD